MKGCRFIVLCLLTVYAGAVFAQKDSRRYDWIIAYVNNDVVTKRELDNVVNQRALELQQVYRFSEREAQRKAEEERPELLDRLIRQMLLVETALTLKIEVTDAEVDQYIDNFKKNYKIETEAEFVEALQKEGYTLMAFREQAKRNLMAERLLMQRILPRLQTRDADIQKFFEENQDQFTTKTDRIHLRHIFLAFKPSEADRRKALLKVRSVIDELKRGKDFEELAKLHAADEKQQESAGALIELPVDEANKLSETFRAALSTLGAGEVSEPIEGSDGYYVFKVERKNDQEIAFRYLAVSLKPSEEAIAETHERADVVLQKLNQGEDFNALAQLYSDDPETKANGGDLGVRSLSELNPNTRQMIEALVPGEHSTPVKTTYGLHIFKVDSREAPELTETEKNQIRALLQEQKFQEEWQAYTDLLMKHAFIKMKPLE
jgi:peptidyl-prolyl cis-trans isomerase SurA